MALLAGGSAAGCHPAAARAHGQSAAAIDQDDGDPGDGDGTGDDGTDGDETDADEDLDADGFPLTKVRAGTGQWAGWTGVTLTTYDSLIMASSLKVNMAAPAGYLKPFDDSDKRNANISIRCPSTLGDPPLFELIRAIPKVEDQLQFMTPSSTRSQPYAATNPKMSTERCTLWMKNLKRGSITWEKIQNVAYSEKEFSGQLVEGWVNFSYENSNVPGVTLNPDVMTGMTRSLGRRLAWQMKRAPEQWYAAGKDANGRDVPGRYARPGSTITFLLLDEEPARQVHDYGGEIRVLRRPMYIHAIDGDMSKFVLIRTEGTSDEDSVDGYEIVLSGDAAIRALTQQAESPSFAFQAGTGGKKWEQVVGVTAACFRDTPNAEFWIKTAKIMTAEQWAVESRGLCAFFVSEDHPGLTKPEENDGWLEFRTGRYGIYKYKGSGKAFEDGRAWYFDEGAELMVDWVFNQPNSPAPGMNALKDSTRSNIDFRAGGGAFRMWGGLDTGYMAFRARAFTTE